MKTYNRKGQGMGGDSFTAPAEQEELPEELYEAAYELSADIVNNEDAPSLRGSFLTAFCLLLKAARKEAGK